VNVTLLGITAATLFSAVHYLPHYTVTLVQGSILQNSISAEKTYNNFFSLNI
jgi:hypothetical protein